MRHLRNISDDDQHRTNFTQRMPCKLHSHEKLFYFLSNSHLSSSLSWLLLSNDTQFYDDDGIDKDIVAGLLETLRFRRRK